MSRESKLILATKYARAFINIFSERLDYSYIKNIENLIFFLEHHKNAIFYLKLPLIKDEIKIDIFQKLFSKFNINDFFLILVKQLINDKRTSLLILVLKRFVKLYQNALGIMNFTITSSHALEEQEFHDIKNFLERKTGKKIEYKIKIDSNLIAGLKIYSDDLAWEYTIDNQLKLLNRD